MSGASDPHWPPHEAVDQCTDTIGEENNQHPHKFVVPLRRLIASAINEHPDPETECWQNNERHDANEDIRKMETNQHITLSFPNVFSVCIFFFQTWDCAENPIKWLFALVCLYLAGPGRM